jgi:7,8-dihydro-6-hydroxymethylpterin-pyrophosphokinase
LPHPRAFERAFVTVPWSLMNPDAVLPGHGSVAALAAEVRDQVWVVK